MVSILFYFMSLHSHVAVSSLSPESHSDKFPSHPFIHHLTARGSDVGFLELMKNTRTLRHKDRTSETLFPGK